MSTLIEHYPWRKLVLERRLPTWGITLLGAVGLVSAYAGFVMSIFSSYTPALPSAYVRPLPLIEVVIISYSFVAVFVTLLVSVGLLARLNIARMAAMILAPAPFAGSVLMVVPQSLRLAIALAYTGISFPGAAPLLLALLLDASILGNPITVLFGLLNLGIPFYLANRHVKSAFRKIRGQKQGPPS